jgi:hypothetical protein
MVTEHNKRFNKVFWKYLWKFSRLPYRYCSTFMLGGCRIFVCNAGDPEWGLSIFFFLHTNADFGTVWSLCIIAFHLMQLEWSQYISEEYILRSKYFGCYGLYWRWQKMEMVDRVHICNALKVVTADRVGLRERRIT